MTDQAQDEQAVVTEQNDQVPSTPAGPAYRHLVIETDGDRLYLRANTMGLLELRAALQMLTRQVDAEIDRKAAPQPTAPAPQADAEVAPDPPVEAAEPEADEEQNDGTV